MTMITRFSSFHFLFLLVSPFLQYTCYQSEGKERGGDEKWPVVVRRAFFFSFHFPFPFCCVSGQKSFFFLFFRFPFSPSQPTYLFLSCFQHCATHWQKGYASQPVLADRQPDLTDGETGRGRMRERWEGGSGRAGQTPGDIATSLTPHSGLHICAEGVPCRGPVRRGQPSLRRLA